MSKCLGIGPEQTNCINHVHAAQKRARVNFGPLQKGQRLCRSFARSNFNKCAGRLARVSRFFSVLYPGFRTRKASLEDLTASGCAPAQARLRSFISTLFFWYHLRQTSNSRALLQSSEHVSFFRGARNIAPHHAQRDGSRGRAALAGRSAARSSGDIAASCRCRYSRLYSRARFVSLKGISERLARNP